MKAVLRPNAFMNLLISATEPYKYECLGPVFGKITGKEILIENAIPFQTAKRSFNSVWHSVKAKKLENFLNHFSSIIGDFHSHSDFKASTNADLSDEDKRTIKAGHISLIIGVRKYKRRINSAITKDEDNKGLSFAINGFKYMLRCYYKNPDKKVKEIRIDKIGCRLF